METQAEFGERLGYGGQNLACKIMKVYNSLDFSAGLAGPLA